MLGELHGFQICLNRIYREYVDERRRDSDPPGPSKPIVERIEQLRSLIRAEKSRLQRISEERIPECKKKIEGLEDDLENIRANPEHIIADIPSRASFIIGIVIIAFLTAYLFIFYTSASYSAFFKEFSQAEIRVANSIFDSQALVKAYYSGATELIFILLTPFIFLGLGFLIHKFQSGKGLTRFLKVGALVSVTFLFDALLAYEITEKIGYIKYVQSFSEGEYVFGIAEALVEANFWLIIFAGFLVYVIWGFVFDFVMEEHDARDAVRNALKAIKTKIIKEKNKISDYQEERNTLQGEIAAKESELQMLENRLARTTFVTKEFELRIDYFTEGWLEWTNANKMSQLNESLIQYRVRFVGGLGTREDVVSAQELRLGQ